MSGSDSSEASPRRSFLKETAAVIIGGVVTLVPAAAGLLVWFDPLRRRAGRGPADFTRIVSLEALPADGVPRRFTVFADQLDAWTKTSKIPVGAVYLRRTDGQNVEALQSICPHAGCFVDYRTDRREFLCPCHTSTFALDGRISDPRSPSPRAMDTLAVEIREGEVWVRFQNFKAGRKEKQVLA